MAHLGRRPPMDILRELQRERDALDAQVLDKAWYGPAAQGLPRRAKELEECSVWLLRTAWEYPSVVFSVGEPKVEPEVEPGAGGKQLWEISQKHARAREWENTPGLGNKKA